MLGVWALSSRLTQVCRRNACAPMTNHERCMRILGKGIHPNSDTTFKLMKLTLRNEEKKIPSSVRRFTTSRLLGGRCRKVTLGVCIHPKLQAPVYDILPLTTAVFSYAIGSRKLSANEQFFVDAQTVVSLLQTTQIKQGVSFIATNKV